MICDAIERVICIDNYVKMMETIFVETIFVETIKILRKVMAEECCAGV